MATEGLFSKKEPTNLPTKNGGVGVVVFNGDESSSHGTVDSNSNPLKKTSP